MRSKEKKVNKDHFIHKHGYGYLFSNRVFVEELIRDFVDEEFYNQLDFNTFEPCLEKTYIGDDFKEFADDLLIKVRLNGKEAYLYLLLEFQSSCDHFMVLRILNYLTHFYLEYIKENKGCKILPPVLPIMIYNGSQKWTAPNNIKKLIEPAGFAEDFYPDFKYFQIIENEIPIDKLERINNAVSTMFMIENTPKDEFEQIVELFDKIIETEQLDTIKLLCIWIEHLLKNERIGGRLYKEIINLANAREVKSMLVETVEQIKNDWMVQGVAQGEHKVLLNQMGRRFGVVTHEEETFIKSITSISKLDEALDKILFAKDKDEILAILRK